VVRNAWALLLFAGFTDELEGSRRGLEYYMLKHSGRIVVHLLILLYLFKGNVTRYFTVEDVPPRRALGALLGACAAVAAAGSAVAILFP